MRCIRPDSGRWNRNVPQAWIRGNRFRTTASIDALTNPEVRVLHYSLEDGREVEIPVGAALRQMQSHGLLRFRSYRGQTRFESPPFWVDAATSEILAA